MNLKKFRERLFILKPNLKDLILEGYSEERAHRIINNEYEFKPKANQNQYSSILLDF